MIETAPDEENGSERRGKRKRRTEQFDVTFAAGMAEGWVFSVPEAFKDQLDILYLSYVDAEKTRTARARMPKVPDGKPPTVLRWAWTRGIPPLLDFAPGHVFYDPPSAYGIKWAEALQILQRLVMVTDATADDPPGEGRVTFTIRTFDSGAMIETTTHRCSQREFEAFLRTGHLTG